MPPTHIKTEINSKVKILDKAYWARNKHENTTFILGFNSVDIIKTLNNDLIIKKHGTEQRYILSLYRMTLSNKHLHTMTLCDTTACPKFANGYIQL